VDPPIAGGWACVTAADGATCTHRPLAAGSVATGYLPVTVTSTAPAGVVPVITVRGAGGPAVTARAKAGVMTDGMRARFAATGQDTVVTAGAPLYSEALSGEAFGLEEDNADGSPGDTVTLPGQVLWAGLYWSGTRWPRTGWSGTRWPGTGWPGTGWPGQAQAQPGQDIALRAPGGAVETVSASDTGVVTGPDGDAEYMSFADVTSMIARYGAGVWSAAPAGRATCWCHQRWGPGWGPGWARESAAPGWALVIVTTDSSASPGTQVMVLDGTAEVGPSLSVPLDALPPGPEATVQTVEWTPSGPLLDGLAQNLAESPSVTFNTTEVPYLAGVIAVSDPP
jgi:hypothetical protein